MMLRRTLIAAALCTLACLALGSTTALASEGPGWQLTAHTYPTYLPPGGRGTIQINVFNIGAGAAKSLPLPTEPPHTPNRPVTVTDTLPPGVTAREAGELITYGNGRSPLIGHERWECSGNGPGGAVAGATVVTCTNKLQPGPKNESMPEIPGGGGLPHDGGVNNLQQPVGIAVDAAGSEASGLVNHVTIAGGRAPSPASTNDPITISSHKPPFGFVGFGGWFSNADGTLDTQAGSHPYEFTLDFDLATAIQKDENLLPAGGEIRDLEIQLPPGIVGDTTAVAQCKREELDAESCPAASTVGVAGAYFSGATELQVFSFLVFNMVPPPGVPAQFGFVFDGITTLANSTVRTGGDNGITTRTGSIAQREVSGTVVTLWGTPSEASHNIWRNGNGDGCSKEQLEHPNPESYCLPASGRSSNRPLFTLPTACSGPLPVKIKANTWQNASVTSEATFQLPGFTGCENLAFGPLIQSATDTSQADSPTGFTVELKPPLGGLQEDGQLGTSDVRDARVTLPQGLVVNPGQAAGLQACQPSQDGLTTQAERAEGKENDGPAACPPASKIGTATIKSPLLEGAEQKQVEGDVYVLQSNPPNVKLLIAGSADGVNIKEVVSARLDEATGQITGVSEGIAQLPFSDFKLHFEGGPKAALLTPPQCGSYETTAAFTPWSSPFLPEFDTSASFAISAGPAGGPCPPSPLPFAPTLTAGSTNAQAGNFSDFTTLISRPDGQQRIERFSFKEPPGMSGMLSNVQQCPEPQASEGNCPAASQIGHAIVQSGPGANPLTLPQPGGPEIPIYLTGEYHGAPFGLSIPTHIVAGPFDLGTILTRAKIEVDPNTAQITIATDPLPQVIKGVPTDIRAVYAVIDHLNFLFNPTNCTPRQFEGSATSAGGAASAPLSARFAVEGCKALPFAPKFSFSTNAHASKANGTSFNVKVAMPQGQSANIGRVDLTIPKILPTRLTTIQKACTEQTFNANPESCPSASKIASAIIHTPVLNNPLQGPVYFVSHGNAAFPDVEMVLNGENHLRIVLDGKTQIKNGVTFSHFETLPDVPFSTFEFKAPPGPFSIFTANGNLCAGPIKVATALTAQSGAVLDQNTPLEVQGCPNSLQLLSRKVKGRTITLKVIVPAAGRLTASGKGLSRSSKSSSARSTLTLSVKAKGHGRLKTKLRLSFTPKKGKRLAKGVGVRVGG